MLWLLEQPTGYWLWAWLEPCLPRWRFSTTYAALEPSTIQIQLVMSTARRGLKSPWSLSGTSAHPIMVTLVNIMVMNRSLTYFSSHVNRPSHSWDKAISDADLETPRSGCGQTGRSYSRPIILLIRFLFISHQSDQQFLGYSYLEIWPWNIQIQGHEWGQSWIHAEGHILYLVSHNGWPSHL